MCTSVHINTYAYVYKIRPGKMNPFVSLVLFFVDIPVPNHLIHILYCFTYLTTFLRYFYKDKVVLNKEKRKIELGFKFYKTSERIYLE